MPPSKDHPAVAPLPSPLPSPLLPSSSPSELQLHSDPEPKANGTIVEALVATCTPFF